MHHLSSPQVRCIRWHRHRRPADLLCCRPLPVQHRRPLAAARTLASAAQQHDMALVMRHPVSGIASPASRADVDIIAGEALQAVSYLSRAGLCSCLGLPIAVTTQERHRAKHIPLRAVRWQAYLDFSMWTPDDLVTSTVPSPACTSSKCCEHGRGLTCGEPSMMTCCARWLHARWRSGGMAAQKASSSAMLSKATSSCGLQAH